MTVEGLATGVPRPQLLPLNAFQSDTSGVFDMLHGTEVDRCHEGFSHSEEVLHRAEAEKSDRSASGLSDMRDETAARFAAGRSDTHLRADTGGDNRTAGGSVGYGEDRTTK